MPPTWVCVRVSVRLPGAEEEKQKIFARRAKKEARRMNGSEDGSEADSWGSDAEYSEGDSEDNDGHYWF